MIEVKKNRSKVEGRDGAGKVQQISWRTRFTVKFRLIPNVEFDEILK